eukprot:30837-Pelagococcus_subviridis.AAC.5
MRPPGESKSPQGPACTTPTRSYGNQCECERASVEAVRPLHRLLGLFVRPLPHGLRDDALVEADARLDHLGHPRGELRRVHGAATRWTRGGGGGRDGDEVGCRRFRATERITGRRRRRRRGIGSRRVASRRVASRARTGIAARL